MATHLPVQTVLISTMKSISIVYKHSFSAKPTQQHRTGAADIFVFIDYVRTKPLMPMTY